MNALPAGMPPHEAGDACGSRRGVDSGGSVAAIRPDGRVMSTALILAVALFFLGMGLVGLARPSGLIRPFGVTLPDPQARAEVRAVYGGFGVAIAGVLALATAHHPSRDGILLAAAAALLGMAFGRVASGVIDTPEAFYPNGFYLVIEVVLAGAVLWAQLADGAD